MDFNREIDDVLSQIGGLVIPQDSRRELELCLIGMRDLDLSRPVNARTRECDDINFDRIIQMLMKFIKLVVDFQNVFGLLPAPIGSVFKVIDIVCNAFFKKDVAGAVIQRFRELKDQELMDKCKATCVKIKYCIRYIKGLPDGNTLSEDEKRLHIQLLSSDMNGLTGLDELLFVGNRIKFIVDKESLNEFKTLMGIVQVYCCLSSFFELFLLYRIGVQISFGVDARPIRNVLESQRLTDKEVLNFLYKPNLRNVMFLHNYNPNAWPITSSFLEKRGLVPEELMLEGKSFQIQSVRKGKKLVACRRPLGLPDALQCQNCTEVHAASKFKFLRVDNNSFVVYCNVYLPRTMHFQWNGGYVMEFTDCPITATGTWHLIKIEPDTPNDDPYYMFQMDSDRRKCMYTGFIVAVYPTRIKYPDTACFWKLIQTD